MVVIQEVAADIGRVTGVGIARNLKRHYRSLLWPMVALLLVANIVNLGADLSAMGAAMALLVGGNGGLYTLLFGILCIVLEVGLSYPRYASVLKWTTLSLVHLRQQWSWSRMCRGRTRCALWSYLSCSGMPHTQQRW